MTPAEEVKLIGDVFVQSVKDDLKWDETMRLAIRAAVAQERERCAKIVEQYSVEVAGWPGTTRSLKPLADIIRSGQ